MMDELDAQIELAENFLRAGNVNRAEALCKEVLEKRHNHKGAFLCLFDVHLAKDHMQKASELCDWRLARCPECPDSHICKLIAFGTLSSREYVYDHVHRMSGENFMNKLRRRLANHPLKLAEAEILYGVYFLDAQETQQLIRKERHHMRLDSQWLDGIESSLNVHTGNTGRAKEALLQRLSKNPQDAHTLHDLSVAYFFSGRLFRAIKYARKAKEIRPTQSAQSQEVIIASILGLIPVFWLGQIILTLTIFLTRNHEDYIAWPIRFCGLLAILLSYAGLASQFFNLETGSKNFTLLFIILIGVWGYYIFFHFGEIGYKLSNREKSIKLSKKY